MQCVCVLDLGTALHPGIFAELKSGWETSRQVCKDALSELCDGNFPKVLHDIVLYFLFIPELFVRFPTEREWNWEVRIKERIERLMNSELAPYVNLWPGFSGERFRSKDLGLETFLNRFSSPESVEYQLRSIEASGAVTRPLEVEKLLQNVPDSWPYHSVVVYWATEVLWPLIAQNPTNHNLYNYLPLLCKWVSQLRLSLEAVDKIILRVNVLALGEWGEYFDALFALSSHKTWDKWVKATQLPSSCSSPRCYCSHFKKDGKFIAGVRDAISRKRKRVFKTKPLEPGRTIRAGQAVFFSFPSSPIVRVAKGDETVPSREVSDKQLLCWMGFGWSVLGALQHSPEGSRTKGKYEYRCSFDRAFCKLTGLDEPSIRKYIKRAKQAKQAKHARPSKRRGTLRQPWEGDKDFDAIRSQIYQQRRSDPWRF